LLLCVIVDIEFLTFTGVDKDFVGLVFVLDAGLVVSHDIDRSDLQVMF